MNLKTDNALKKLNKKWIDRLSANRPEYQYDRYIGSGKAGIACKCPKCGSVHEVFLHWAGRGMPRIYCNLCRPVIASLSDTDSEWCGTSFARSARKSGCAFTE